MVQERRRNAAFKQLMAAKVQHSKMSSLQYGNLQIQSYLVNKSFHSGDAKLLFSLRTRMANVRNNYKNGYDNLHCPLCCHNLDTQEHLPVCDEIHTCPPDVSYNDIFSDDCERIRQTFVVLKKSLHIREEILQAAEEAGV